MRNFKYIVLLILILGAFLAVGLRGVLGVPTKSDILNSLKVSGQAFESSQERARYGLTQAIIDGKTLKMDSQAEIAIPDISYKDNHYYSVFPPGLSLLVAPAYYLGEKIGHPVITTFAMPALASILTAIFIFLICVNFFGTTRLTALLGAITFSLCTIAFSYSVTLSAHLFSALCLTSAFYFSLRSKKGSGWNHFLVGAIYGLSILIDYPNAIILLPVVVYMIANSFNIVGDDKRNQKSIKINFAFLAGIFPIILAIAGFALYNTATLGGWSELAHNYRVTALVEGVADYKFPISKALDIKYIENGLYTLIFSPSRGLIMFSPILIMAIFGFVKLAGKQAISNTIAASLFLNLAVYASFYDPWGGWSFGPRYLIAGMPLLAILTALGYEHYRRYSAYLLSFGLLFFASFGIAILGVLTTNLLPPAAEIGSQVGFTTLIPRLFSLESGSLIINLVNKYLHLPLIQFYVILSGLFAAIFAPVFARQLAHNIIIFFSKNRRQDFSILTKGQEANAN